MAVTRKISWAVPVQISGMACFSAEVIMESTQASDSPLFPTAANHPNHFTAASNLAASRIQDAHDSAKDTPEYCAGQPHDRPVRCLKHARGTGRSKKVAHITGLVKQ